MAGDLPQLPLRKRRLPGRNCVSPGVSAPGAVFLFRDGEWSIELTPVQGDRLAAAILEQTKQARPLMSARSGESPFRPYGRTLEPVT